MTQSNYPHTSNTIRLVNPPRFISAVWRLITPLLDADTMQKMAIEPREAGAFEPPEEAKPLA